MNKFGTRSAANLATAHEDLQKVMNLALSRSRIDFGVSEGHRSVERQNQLFQEGKSKIDGVNKKGKHNFNPSLAVDIYAYHPDPATRRKIIWDLGTLCYIAGIVVSTGQDLHERGEISHVIRWGGNWDRDGVILHDQSFDDLPHFELRTP